MPVKLKEFFQDQFSNAGADLYRKTGDFDTATSLLPSLDGRKIIRAPTLSAHYDFPSDFTDCRGAYYRDANGFTCFVGQDSDVGDMAWCYADSAWSVSATQTPVLTAVTSNLGGLAYQNLNWRGGALWVIGVDGNVYGVSPTAGLTARYAGTDAKILVPVGDYPFIIATGGTIHKADSDLAAFSTFYDPASAFSAAYATGMQHELIIVETNSGDFTFYSIDPDNPLTMQPVTRFHAAGKFATAVNIYQRSCLFTLHDDQIYFCTYQYTQPSQYNTDLYRFDGNSIEYVATARDTAISHNEINATLMTWQGRLLYVEMEDGSATAAYTIKMPVGTGFITLYTAADFNTATPNPTAHNLGENIILISGDGTHEGFYYLNRKTLQDGTLETSWLTFDSGREKRLEEINVYVDTAAADLYVKIHYKTDDGAYTQAVSTANATHVTIGSLGVDFYRLKIKIEIDDNTGTNKDIGIEALSVIYTLPN